jgi:hypothetical protein
MGIDGWENGACGPQNAALAVTRVTGVQDLPQLREHRFFTHIACGNYILPSNLSAASVSAISARWEAEGWGLLEGQHLVRPARVVVTPSPLTPQ